MISRFDLDERVREWSLRDDIVEKDYVLGWLLWGIGSHELLGTRWAFKGGTCLKKCYVETYRFSEDLDFTVLPGGPIRPEELMPALQAALSRVTEASGLNFGGREPLLRAHESGLYTEGRVYYQGPRGATKVASVKLDLSASERVVRPTVMRRIHHAYPDGLPEPATVCCYCFEEVFAEKIRAMGERGRPRDLYDIVNLFRRPELDVEAAVIRAILGEKCRVKGIPVPTLATVKTAANREALESEWSNMLAHQLPVLPPFEDFWEELEHLFGWLEKAIRIAALPRIPVAPAEMAPVRKIEAVPMQVWRANIPLETIRFAASNHLCVRLGYHGSYRIIEPYSLRRTQDGHLVLHAIRVDNREHRSYRIDRIESVEATTRSFKPVYMVEFSSVGPIRAPETQRSAAPVTRHSSSLGRSTGTVYVIECPYCHKRFQRTTHDTKLNPHKSPDGFPCSARHGMLVDTRYK
ncbi:MAG TPA: nucleotidyl transferase AbiEii/AbiGii toxin family protein [Candidatus Hydrogenedentes bacterium]|mgnify:CR=1 FL=1|nr:nucleotidyl transferase AbiEii/AbiGii toxin family protein [Candidatus Hydrogenedentota bacterium]HOV75469.1 nucleotidyl transferase AbiEii/AbiGii toxin family protein [Candidatus Hydrogenedentota bacterium]